MAAGLGVAFWGWTFAYDLTKPFLKIFGLSYLMAGFWILASTLMTSIVRKPGVALISSLMAAFIEGLLTHWGPQALLWGLVQGIGAEVVFAIFYYRRFGLWILVLASCGSAAMSYALDYFYYDYRSLSLTFNLLQLGSFLVSASLFSGALACIFSLRLKKLGLLDQFLIAKEPS